jgi:hypothetical protein
VAGEEDWETMNGSLPPVIKEYRAKFNKQKKQQRIPANTCPAIDALQRYMYGDGDMTKLSAFRKLEGLRESNTKLRQIGIDWYELCRDLLDDLEMTQKLYEKSAR